MANFTKIAKCITSTSLLLALDGPLFVLFGYFLYGNEISFTVILAAFLMVFAVYNLNKVTDITEDAINRPETTGRSKRFYVASSVAAISLSITLGTTVSLLAVAFLLTPLIIGVFYSVKFSQSIPRLKEITGVKSLLVAFSWSVNGALLPLVSQPAGIEKVFFIFTYLFIQVFVNTVLFDFFDIKGDLVSGTRTIPVMLGRSKTKGLLLFLNNALFVVLAFYCLNGLFLKFMPALIFGLIYSNLAILHFTKNNSKRLQAELIIDGAWLPIVALMGITV